LLGASLDNATMHAEELVEFETQLATVHTICTIYTSCEIYVYNFAQIFDVIITSLQFCRLHRHLTKDEIFRSSINE